MELIEEDVVCVSAEERELRSWIIIVLGGAVVGFGVLVEVVDGGVNDGDGENPLEVEGMSRVSGSCFGGDDSIGGLLPPSEV